MHPSTEGIEGSVYDQSVITSQQCQLPHAVLYHVCVDLSVSVQVIAWKDSSLK